jgi:hypothetical protein
MTSRLITKALSIIILSLVFGPLANSLLIRVQLLGIRPFGHPLKFKSWSTTTPFRLFLVQDDAGTADEGGSSAVETELGQLKDQLSLIEALEARNEAQLDSFIDEEDQWNSLEEEERNLLEAKVSIIQRMELLTEQLIQLWMGQKSMEG